MEIKKCFITGEVIETTTDTTTTATAAQSNGTSPAVRPAKVVEHVSLGKILKAVDRKIAAQSTDLTRDTNGIAAGNASWSGNQAINPRIGNGHIKAARPIVGEGSSNPGDPLRAEAKKFFVLNDAGQLVYLNSSLSEDVSSGDTALDAAWGRSPLTIQGPVGPITETTTGLFK